MAKNPKWRGSVSEWKKYFSGWINEPNPAELMKVNIFFDFRCVFGSEKLTQILRKHISETTKGKSVFFLHLAKNAISNKPPLKFLGSFDTTSKGKHRNFFDIKRPLLIISDYARIYALKYNSKETNTLKRLEIFTKKGILDKAEYAETLQAYNILMQHRFKHQAELLSKNKKPDNFINPKNLTKIERDILKSAFNQINLISKKIKFLIQFNLL